MKLVKPGEPVGEFDIYLGPATVNGKPIGKWYQSRTAEQHAIDEELANKLRSAYRKMAKRTSEQWRVPVFGKKQST